MNIIERQELSDNIELLAAQRNLYSKAKNIIGIQMMFSVPIALCTVITTITKPDLGGYIALWGILVVLLDLFVFTPWVKSLQDGAARIQELFDVRVLGLTWDDISVGKRPDPELVHREAKKHGMQEEKISCLRQWYPASIEGIQEIFGVIISQRANIWWDSKMRRRYTLSIRIILVVITVGLVGYGLYEKKGMFDFLAYIIAPLAPTYVFGYRQMMEHSEAADRLDTLKEYAEKIWGNAVGGKDTAELRLESRVLQDQIFNHRRKNPPVFDFIFRLFRNENEELMNKGADSLIRDLTNAN